MKNKLLGRFLIRKSKLQSFFKDSRGETNIVAIILIIVVVIGLVVIFRDRITILINNIFDKIDTEVNNIPL